MENILNIINFIRGAEPRNRSIDLVEPVREQIKLLKAYGFPGTFLIQYDAMLRSDITDLLADLPHDQFEIGLWLEMNQPHVEACGLPWRGREGFEWDWHAHVGFSVGYTPRERELLIDEAMRKFREVFHRDVHSVGSWMIDAHALRYLDEKYAIDASCNCKDQWGTDGYTIWGGYWNQGYYPSRRCALCPAQTAGEQINVPVFRMLGSDPVAQYDLGLSVSGGAPDVQHVASLEPVYGSAGADGNWVNWFMRQNFTGRSLAFAYAQAGQENSFGWPRMEKGFKAQFATFDRWRDRLRIEKLGDTGRWYKAHFPLTPATAVAATEPFGERQAQSVWYDTRNYRVNVYADAEGLRLRDVTLFDERRAERYLSTPCETEYLVYDNLSVMDGNRMSGRGVHAGAWLVGEDGAPLRPDDLTVREEGAANLEIRYDGGRICLSEERIALHGANRLEFRRKDGLAGLVSCRDGLVIFEQGGDRFGVRVEKGVARADGLLSIAPQDGQIMLSFDRLR